MMYRKYPKTTIPKGRIATKYNEKVQRITSAAIVPEITIPTRLKKRATLSPIALSILNVFSLKLLNV